METFVKNCLYVLVRLRMLVAFVACAFAEARAFQDACAIMTDSKLCIVSLM